MSILFATILCLVSINPIPFDKPEVYIDGYIEINHFWQMSDLSTRKINGVEVLHGTCVFDQIIIWKFNKTMNRFEVFHWQIIKDGRDKDRLFGDEKEEELKRVYKRWESEHIKLAKANKTSVDNVSIYYDSEWTGPRSLLNRPMLNQYTKKYEVLMKPVNREEVYKIICNSLIETNTEFDPEGTISNEQEIGPSQRRFKGYIK